MVKSDMTISGKERFLAAIKGEELDRPPVWIMRQAGRYMPAYKEIAQREGFKAICEQEELCVEVSLLPQKLLDPDLLIVFNDILTPLEAMGLSVEFPTGGPQIEPQLRSAPVLESLNSPQFDDPAVARNLRAIRNAMKDEPGILGFAGAPFTLLAFAAEGKMTKNHEYIKKLLFEEPKLAHQFLEMLTTVIVRYLIAQVEQGKADGVQLFESLGSTLSLLQLNEFALPYLRRVIGKFKESCPDTPVILYCKGGLSTLDFMESSGADVLSIDWTLPLAEARSRTEKPLQGNLDPMALASPSIVREQLLKTLDGFDWRKGWIANLGHGITPQATEEGAIAYVRAIKDLGK